MIIPSIDLLGGQTVQLIGGTEHALDAGDPRPIAQRFGDSRARSLSSILTPRSGGARTPRWSAIFSPSRGAVSGAASAMFTRRSSGSTLARPRSCSVRPRRRRCSANSPSSG